VHFHLTRRESSPSDWFGLLAAIVLAAVELFLPNRGSPEYIGLDLARYQTQGVYIPYSPLDVFTRPEARSHWVYYAVAFAPLLLMIAVICLRKANARRVSIHKGLQRGLKVASGIIGIGALLLLVWTLSAAKFPRISWTIAPPPILVVQAFGHYYQPPGNPNSLLAELVPCALRTSFSLFIAIVVATSLALVLGLALGHLRTLSGWVSPYVYMISPLPPIVLFPVFNALSQPSSMQQVIGYAYAQAITPYLVIGRDLALTIWAVFWPIFAAALDGSRLVNPRLLAGAQLLGAGRWHRLWKVVLPQSIGAILTNFRLGVIMGMIVLLFAQAKGGESQSPEGLQKMIVPGLGGKLAHLDDEQSLAPILACVVTVIVVVLLFDLIRLLLERFCFPWLSVKRAGEVLPEPAAQASTAGASIERIKTYLRAFIVRPAAPEAIVVRNLIARFGSFTLSVPELTIPHGQVVSLIGKSSSGKTSLVEVVSGMGLHTELSGSVTVNGHEVYCAGIRSERTNNLGVGFVHQDHGLFSHLTVRKNLDFATRLKQRTWDRERRRRFGEIESQVRSDLFDFLGLSSDKEILAKYPSQLSGGQRQRVAIARALLTAEPLLVFDEGLSSIDQPTRSDVRDGLCDLVRELNLTLLAVSHDNQDVLRMSDRILYMERHGTISTIVANSTPQDFYYTPYSEEAARFIGHYNVFKVELEEATTAAATLILRPVGAVQEPIHVAEERIPLRRKDNILVIPASWVNPSRELVDATFTGTIVSESFAGPHHELMIKCDGGFLLKAIVQDDDYVFLAQFHQTPECMVPMLKNKRVGLSIGHSICHSDSS
jgi:sulfate/thiosulfate transport system ATP-binding protein